MSVSKLSFFILTLMFVASCSNDLQKHPSVLIIAASALGFSDLNCDTEELDNVSSRQGFDVLCKESIRFTHAYTPSILSQPALASLLTGKYPIEHGLRRNGNDFLSANEQSIAEEALKKGYKTSFFSGGPPIWRMSGLGQGFEIFDDNIKLGNNSLYRPAQTNFKKFINWHDARSRRSPFFTVIYLPDLQFPNSSTMTNLGEVRRKTYQGQIEELNESVEFLVNALKSRGRWDNTNIIFLGLQGRVQGLYREQVAPLTLFSEKSHVALLIKPARKQRDLGLNWKIDKNVSLVDVGATVVDLIGRKKPQSKYKLLEVVSLKTVFNKAKADWSEERALLIESGWGRWRLGTSIRYAIRKGKFFSLVSNPIQTFNSLVDPNEQYSISQNHPVAQKMEKYIQRKFVGEHKIPYWREKKSKKNEFLKIKSNISKIETGRFSLKEELKIYLTRYPNEKKAANLLARLAIVEGNWEELKWLGKKFNVPVWAYVANKNLDLPTKKISGPCIKYFSLNIKSIRAIRVHECKDPVFISLLRWKAEEKTNKKASLKEEFLRKVAYEFMDYKIEKHNSSLFDIWPLNNVTDFSPSLSELYLNLPNLRQELKIVNNRKKL